MREIAQLNNNDSAEHFSAFLNLHDIENIIIEEKNKFQIWILNEDHIKSALNFFKEFNHDPKHEKFQKAKNQKAKANYKKEEKTSPIRFQKPSLQGVTQMPVFTFITIGICVFVFFLQNVNERNVFVWLAYDWPSILEGQIWRLFTPIIMHGGFLHLLFNLYWVYFLSSSIEIINGRRFLIIFILVSALTSNTLQYFRTGPNFLGISGVVFAMLGYIYMKSRYDDPPVFHIDTMTVVIMIIFLLLGVFEVLSTNVANSAHIGGLLTGLMVGFFHSDHGRQLLRLKRR